MRFLPLLLCAPLASQAATIASPDLVSTLVAVSDGDSTDNDPSNLVDLKDLVNNKGDVGDVLASTSGLILGMPNTDDFDVTSSNLQSFIERDQDSGNSVSGSATSSFTISFALASGEEGDLSLSFASVLQNLGVGSSATWSLTGPDANASSMSGSLSSNGSSSTNQSVSLSTAGSYTFSITAQTGTQSLTSSSPAIDLNVNNFSLNYVRTDTIPEPSAFCLFCLSGLLLNRRHRRS